MSFDLGNYEDVAARRRRLYDIHPAASIQVTKPVYVQRPDDTWAIRVAASVYRHEGDPYPGVDWTEEPFPGRTAYTKGSEVENASTSAIGRAILCVIGPAAGHSGSSLQEVQARQQEDHPLSGRVADVIHDMQQLTERQQADLREWANERSLSGRALLNDQAWLEQVEAWIDENGNTLT